MSSLLVVKCDANLWSLRLRGYIRAFLSPIACALGSSTRTHLILCGMWIIPECGLGVGIGRIGLGGGPLNGRGAVMVIWADCGVALFNMEDGRRLQSRQRAMFENLAILFGHASGTVRCAVVVCEALPGDQYVSMVSNFHATRARHATAFLWAPSTSGEGIVGTCRIVWNVGRSFVQESRYKSAINIRWGTMCSGDGPFSWDYDEQMGPLRLPSRYPARPVNVIYTTSSEAGPHRNVSLNRSHTKMSINAQTQASGVPSMKSRTALG
ncbi:hypothetical protein DFH06DRAFT_1370914 [Mycena polygramma]|nr:hypothetical protein DFH06DRAFT_1370914 [Mycena polygramma]